MLDIPQDAIETCLRATYSYTVHDHIIAIVDHDKGRSVTNDVKNVLEDLRHQGYDLNNYRVIYQDTRGIWDEIAIDKRDFAGFRSINTPDLDSALKTVEAKHHIH